MNRVELIGRITKDAELRYTASNTAVSKFTLAITRQKNNDGTEETDFIPCTAFGKRAELIGKYCKKGDQMAIEGNIRTGSYEKEGKKYYTTEVYIDNVQFLTKKEKPTTVEIPPKEEPPVVITESASDKIFQAFGEENFYSEDDVAF